MPEDKEKEPVKELMPILIDAATAGIEVGKWLDYKRVKPTKRAAYSQYINELIQAVMYGDLVLQNDFSFVHKLNHPILNEKTEDILFDTLTYAPRLSAQKLSEALQGVDVSDEVANSIAFGYALSGKAIGLVGRMDTVDLRVLSAIAIFF